MIISIFWLCAVDSSVLFWKTYAGEPIARLVNHVKEGTHVKTCTVLRIQVQSVSSVVVGAVSCGQIMECSELIVRLYRYAQIEVVLLLGGLLHEY